MSRGKIAGLLTMLVLNLGVVACTGPSQSPG